MYPSVTPGPLTDWLMKRRVLTSPPGFFILFSVQHEKGEVSVMKEFFKICMDEECSRSFQCTLQELIDYIEAVSCSSIIL